MLRQALAKGAPWGAALTRPFASAADSASAALQTAGERDFMRYTSPVPSTFDHTEGLAGPPTKVRFRAHPYMHRAIGYRGQGGAQKTPPSRALAQWRDQDAIQ